LFARSFARLLLLVALGLLIAFGRVRTAQATGLLLPTDGTLAPTTDALDLMDLMEEQT
jgi:hypothetical protein